MNCGRGREGGRKARRDGGGRGGRAEGRVGGMEEGEEGGRDGRRMEEREVEGCGGGRGIGKEGEGPCDMHTSLLV